MNTLDTESIYPAVVEILRAARGAAAAVPINRIVSLLGLDVSHSTRRQIEHVLEVHLDSFPFFLVAGSGGYYIPTSAEDINHYLRSLESRCRALFIRRRTTIKRAHAAGYRRQGRTFLDPLPVSLGQQEFFKQDVA